MKTDKSANAANPSSTPEKRSTKPKRPECPPKTPERPAKTRLKNLTLCALFCALTVAATLLIKLPLPVSSGFVHLGDAVIFLSALFLPVPYAAAAGAVGAAAADLILGWSMYAPFTLAVKALMTLVFWPGARKKPSRLIYLLQSAGAGLVTVGGYYAVDRLLYGAGGAALNLIGNCVQAAGSVAMFALLLGLMSAPAVKRQLGPRL